MNRRRIKKPSAPRFHHRIGCTIIQLFSRKGRRMQALVTFKWIKSVSPDVVKQVLIVSKDNGVVTHQTLTPDVETLQVALDVGMSYSATLTASNTVMDSDPTTVTFTTPVPVKPDAPTALTVDVVLQ